MASKSAVHANQEPVFKPGAGGPRPPPQPRLDRDPHPPRPGAGGEKSPEMPEGLPPVLRPNRGTPSGGKPGDHKPPKATLGDEAELQAMRLRPGTPGRAAFDKFKKYFNEEQAHKADQPWVFCTNVGDESKDKVLKLKDAYAAGKHRLPNEEPGTTLHNFIDDFPFAELPKKLGPGPPPNEDLWHVGVVCFACARLASTRGGPVRILIPKGQDLVPPHKAWSDFEAYELTRPGGKVPEIWRYGSNNSDAPPELAWSRARGDRPLGKLVDFSKKMGVAAETQLDAL